MILGFRDYEQQGRQLAELLDRRFALVDVHRFPDGESKITLPAELPDDVIVCRSLDRPNDKLVELLLVAETARVQGAKRLILVAPYLCYMRQDIAFQPGEAISQRIIGAFLAQLFDGLITVDPHLHRIRQLSEAVPGIPAQALSSAPAMVKFLQARGGHPLLLGPDSESEQWVRAIAEPAGLDFAVATKERLGDRSVHVVLPNREYSGQEVVLVDDMVSTGHTLASVAKELKARGASAVHCLVTHALYDDSAAQLLKSSGLDAIWSSDSVRHPSNAFPLGRLLADAVTGLR